MLNVMLHRHDQPIPWAKIPWDDPDFSRRMLAEHLSQAHDAASRRQTVIDAHAAWIHGQVLSGTPSRVLDLGCGPGFYTRRLAALGHTCRGLDFSPASIAYAREQHPHGDYALADVRAADFGSGWDLAMLIYGELNAFAPEEAAQIIGKAYAALRPGGRLLLEVHPWDVVEREGRAAPNWHTAQRGLFADTPYLCLTEASFDGRRAVTQIYVLTEDGAAPATYTTMLQAYTDDDYRHQLRDFARVSKYPSLTGQEGDDNLVVWVAEKA
jgi:SAM-dependent methyltransferase